MESLALALGLAIPWLLGIGVLLVSEPDRTQRDSAGIGALTVGNGFFVGVLLLTLWMRGVGAVGLGFGRLSIGAPLGAVAVAMLAWGWRSNQLGTAELRRGWKYLLGASLPRWPRIAWLSLLAWLVLRLILLAGEVAWQPLYPQDAWTQWATKARVWYELGRMAPFVHFHEWLERSGAFIDAVPTYPATVPLLQVWSCIALGRWDDSAMNWPWLLTLIALFFTVYGALRGAGIGSLGALVGAYLVASLPFLEVHVALAGYADLMMGAFYTVAALALYRWATTRHVAHGIWALFFALSCVMVKTPGIVWALTLAPGAIMVLLPRQGYKIVAALFALAVLAVLALAQFEISVLGYQFRLDFQPDWSRLFVAYFMAGNWNLMWYIVVALLALGWRHLRAPKLAPLTAIVAAGLGFLFVGFVFTNAAVWLTDLSTLNRATLHVAPLLLTFSVLLWHEIVTARARPGPSHRQSDDGGESARIEHA